MTSNHVSSDSEPSPPNPTCLSNFLASGCPPTLPVSDVPVRSGASIKALVPHVTTDYGNTRAQRFTSMHVLL